MRWIVAAGIFFAASPARAQRVQFPTMVDGGAALPPAATAAPQVQFQSAPLQPAAVGSLQGSPATWDQYADTAAAGQYSPYAPSPYAPPPAQGAYPAGAPSPFPEGGFFSAMQQPLRLLQEVRMRGTWIQGDGGSSPDELGVTVAEGSATFAFPFFYLETPLLVTPGFAANWFDGPMSVGPGPPDLPPQVYDAFLDFGWQPQITTWLGANLGVRVGVYSDFEEFTSRSLRIMGRALAVFTFSPTVQLAAGVVYLDRLEIKLLPAGGVIWTPNPDARYEILFPNPKLARRYTTIGTTDVWLYLAGEIGGGSWTIQRPSGSDAFDYNDLRVLLGIEGVGLNGNKIFFEVGYVFDREIVYLSGIPDKFEPDSTVMLRAGLSF